MKFTLDILQDQAHMTQFPDFVKPYVLLLLQDLVPADTRLTHCHATSLAGAWSSCARQSVLQMVHILKPITDERKAKMREYGAEWTDKPVSDSEFKSLHRPWVALANIADFHL